ncbi:MAG TPA: bifunctional DNA-formamidopyrimidine glycosylase/DNA-(apurinic or apyrimidinic site) lyase [Methylococcaceae bacterium]|nr:bifunctional DNA-formamidopyrimidine glycosylase/DNA-(apurinic or apyrimidinic site) lyase [Methylococcaceae bacterium]
MPELPEVETTRRGLSPHVVGRRVADVLVRERRLRWPVPDDLAGVLRGREILEIGRRGKYLLFRFAGGALIVHLGMSGSLRLAAAGEAVRRHDHVDILLDQGPLLRYHDPRRFGAMLWTPEPASHSLFAALGPEPLGEEFSPDYLWTASRGRRTAVKPFLMNAAIVVGVGNIYASEALFLAGVHPARETASLEREECMRLVAAIRQVLSQAIEMGGTTLRDFVNGHGQPGYFQQALHAYGRSGQSCMRCGTAIETLRLGQRASYFCPVCQG